MSHQILPTSAMAETADRETSEHSDYSKGGTENSPMATNPVRVRGAIAWRPSLKALRQLVAGAVAKARRAQLSEWETATDEDDECPPLCPYLAGGDHDHTNPFPRHAWIS